MRTHSQKSAECGEQHGYQTCDNSSLYMYFKELFFRIFSSGLARNPDIFALRRIPTLKIGDLGAEISVLNHKSIPIYN